MSDLETQQGTVDVNKIMLSIRAEVIRDLLQRHKVRVDVTSLMHSIPLPDFSVKSGFCKLLYTVPPFKQITHLLLRMGRSLFIHYSVSTRITMELLVEELDRQNYIIRHLLDATEKKN